MFKLEDKVVYPGHGVAIIEDIIEKRVNDKNLKFFKLRFLYKDMTILVPLSSADSSCSFRALSSKIDIDRAFCEIVKPSKKLETLDFTPSSWNKRNKIYQLKLQSGNIIDIAAIYRDLMFTARYKDLSFGEKNLLQLAEELLLQEILEVKNLNKDTVIQELRRPFKQATFDGLGEQHRSNVTKAVQV